MDLELPSTTVGLDGLCRSAQVDDGIFKGLLVVQPCSAFRVKRLLNVFHLSLKVCMLLLEFIMPILQGNKVGLR